MLWPADRTFGRRSLENLPSQRAAKLAALLPGVAAYVWIFGPIILVALFCIFAILVWEFGRFREALVVAGVNIAHTFFRAIAERRHELGVMRAVGASRADVLLLLLLEAMTVGLCGGVLGVLLARAVGALIDLLSRTALPDFPFKPDSYFWFSPGLLAGLLGFSVGVCLLGAVWPARAAARLSPAEALQGRS